MTHRLHRAVTLVEVLIVAVIAAILAGILLSVFGGVKKQSKVAVTMSNLRQIHLAIAMYRDETEATGTVGDLIALGLPTADWYMDFLAKKNLFPPQPGPTPGLGWYYYLVPDPSTTSSLTAGWKRHNDKCRENSVIIADYTFLDRSAENAPPGTRHHAYGLTLGGQIVQRTAPGFILSPDWWDCQETQP